MTENASIPEKHLRKDDAYTIAQRGSWEFVTPGPPPTQKPRYNWDRVKDRIGVLPDRDIAQILGCTPTAVALYRKRHHIPGLPRSKHYRTQNWDLVQDSLGIKRDSEIARQLGCSIASVIRYRKIHGIPSPPRKKHKTKYDWASVDDIIGRVPDREIAQILGCGASTVRQHRYLRGIRMVEGTATLDPKQESE
jgi:hypothetical protein